MSECLQMAFATQSMADAVSVAHEAARYPVEAVSKPVRDLQTYFLSPAPSEDALLSSRESGHAMQPLLSSFAAHKHPGQDPLQ